MRRRGWFRCDLRPLAHPLWWAALALLAANDHVFKRTGILPRWVTGKLSDFAFLIVAPVLLAVLLPSPLRRRRAIAVAAVALIFSAAKLSRSVSAALVTTLSHLGVAWRLWPDPSDLVALSMLPLAAFVMRPRPAAAGVGSRRRQQAAAVLGALTCVATSAPPRFPHNAFLLNAAPGSATIRTTWVLRTVPCSVLTANPPDASATTENAALQTFAASLTPGDLDDPREFSLLRGQVLPLDGDPPPELSPAGMCATNVIRESYGACVAVILESPPAAPVLMAAPARWDESEEGLVCTSAPTSRCQPMMNPGDDPGPDAVTLKQVNGSTMFVAGAELRMITIDLDALAGRSSPPGNCRSLRAEDVALEQQPQTCTVDTDCVAVYGPGVTGGPRSCGLYANLAGADALSTVSAAWAAGCTHEDLDDGCSVPVQPAVCRNGACAPACPGEDIPTCPRPCATASQMPGAPCDGDTRCSSDGGSVCNCVNGAIACGPPQPTSATCPVICNDWPGGGTYAGGVVIHPDGGAAADTANGGAGGASTGGAGGAPVDVANGGAGGGRS